ncbi:DUF4157 domain-containing protein [Streptomyces olivoreticuli]|uniref:eCIS core domain-containing protein n=1 Tax=Streptomyces olivoreticuli TaxID=68246 RepID=UPI000E26D72F|nr:DUF4157 domain-containing protein [Streptomyces olivoreticuli]
MTHAHEYGHDRDDAQEKASTAPQASPELPYLFRAAATHRPDVIDHSGAHTLQRTAGNRAVRGMLQREAEESGGTPRSSVHDVISSGGGRALDAGTRADMEARLGADFSDVRVHTDGAAHESARDVGARAYTVGNDVVFQRDAYDPSSHEGRTTLAHELTHVIQQRSGPVEGTEAPGGIRVSDPSDRFEREAAANAERVMAQPPVERAAVAAPAAPAAPSVQREAADEDEEPADVQGSFVQRSAEQGGEEEETPE